jgi:hypothetical protein
MFFPLLETPINQYLFERSGLTPAFAPVRRKMAVSIEGYREMVVTFNAVVKACKKNKEQYILFTGLMLFFKEDELLFTLSSESDIVHLERPFYQGIFEPLERSLASNYSEIHLQPLYKDNKLQACTVFPFLEVKSKLLQQEKLSVMGVVQSIGEGFSSPIKAVNAKEKEIVLEVLQDVFRADFVSVGVCRICLRFDQADEREVMATVKRGCCYVFLISDTVLTDNMALLFRLNQWRRSIIRIFSDPLPLPSLEDKFREMRCSSIKMLREPCLYRNYYKFRLTKVELRFLNFKASCQLCNCNVLRIGDDSYACRGGCGEVRPRLKSWAIVGCMDQTGYSELSLDDHMVLTFFNLEEEEGRIT